MSAYRTGDAASRHLDSVGEHAIFAGVRTTLNIDDDLLAEARRSTGIDSKSRIIEIALRALIKQVGRERLAASYGTIPKAKVPKRRRLRRGSS